MVSKTIPRKPTFKEANWLKDYSESGSASNAASKNYSCSHPKSAGVIGTENLAKLRNGVFDLSQAKLSSKICDETEVLELLSSKARKAKQESNQIRAAEILAKVHGLQRDRQEIEQVKHKSNEDLNREFEALAQGLEASTASEIATVKEPLAVTTKDTAQELTGDSDDKA